MRAALILVASLGLAATTPAAAAKPVAAVFAGGCFWCTEADFDKIPGVLSTTSGYTGGKLRNPTYEQVSAGGTGHIEAVRVVYDPSKVEYADLVATFYEVHDPTQGYRQGNDVGTQYRSAIYVETPEQEKIAREITERYQPELTERGYGPITTEIKPAPDFYYAEDYHQQYLDKNPFGYCPVHATGVTCN